MVSVLRFSLSVLWFSLVEKVSKDVWLCQVLNTLEKSDWYAK